MSIGNSSLIFMSQFTPVHGIYQRAQIYIFNLIHCLKYLTQMWQTVSEDHDVVMAPCW
jgi:hypothetical protein